jgi:hypothetical protein
MKILHLIGSLCAIGSAFVALYHLAGGKPSEFYVKTYTLIAAVAFIVAGFAGLDRLLK